MPVIKIKSRLAPSSPAGSSAQIGRPTSLAAGELAFNAAGVNLVDKAGGGALFIGNGSRVVTLISSERQVETGGNQTIRGVKTFADSLRIGSVPYSFPILKGNALESLRMDAAGNNLEWVAPKDLTINRFSLTATTGSVDGNLNANPTSLNVGSGELWVVTDTETNKVFLWTGGAGTFGTAGGGTPATAAMFSGIGGVVKYASDIEVQAGVEPAKVIAPDVAAQELFQKNAPSGDQMVTVPVTRFAEIVPGDNNGQVEFLNDVAFGDAGIPITVTGKDGSTLQGEVANPLVIDNAVIDGGVY